MTPRGLGGVGVGPQGTAPRGPEGGLGPPGTTPQGPGVGWGIQVGFLEVREWRKGLGHDA